MTTATPVALAAFITTTNAGDSAGFIAAFTEDAVLEDWGRVFHGREGVAAWNRTDNIGVRAQFELVSIAAGDAPDAVIAVLTVSGDGYNGTGPMSFQLRGDKIARLTIAAA